MQFRPQKVQESNPARVISTVLSSVAKKNAYLNSQNALNGLKLRAAMAFQQHVRIDHARGRRNQWISKGQGCTAA